MHSSGQYYSRLTVACKNHINNSVRALMSYLKPYFPSAKQIIILEMVHKFRSSWSFILTPFPQSHPLWMTFFLKRFNVYTYDGELFVRKNTSIIDFPFLSLLTQYQFSKMFPQCSKRRNSKCYWNPTLKITLIHYVKWYWISTVSNQTKQRKQVHDWLKFYGLFISVYVYVCVVEGNHSCLPLKQLDYKRNVRTSVMSSSHIALNKKLQFLNVRLFFFTILWKTHAHCWQQNPSLKQRKILLTDRLEKGRFSVRVCDLTRRWRKRVCFFLSENMDF